jgi:hypothetical protein
MSTRALLVAGTSGKLLPFSAVHANLALGLEQTVLQAHRVPASALATSQYANYRAVVAKYRPPGNDGRKIMYMEDPYVSASIKNHPAPNDAEKREVGGLFRPRCRKVWLYPVKNES